MFEQIIEEFQYSQTNDTIKNQFKDWFYVHKKLVSKSFKHIIRNKNNVISTSLFYCNCDNHYYNEFPKPSKQQWKEKYFHKLLELIQQLQNFQELKQFKLRIHLDFTLQKYIPMLIDAGKAIVEIYVIGPMQGSVGAQPGMLWRFLPLGDTSLDVVFVIDIDELFDQDVKLQMLQHFILHSRTLFGRFLSTGGINGTFQIAEDSTAKNYPAVLGSRVLAKPKLIASHLEPFWIEKYMLSFIQQCIERSKSYQSTTVYNLPIHHHIYGWGYHWCSYGFDETFLKCMILPIFSKKGLTTTYYVNENIFESYEGKADKEYQLKHKNSIYKLAFS